jgi:hypothetical protein
VAVNTDGCIAIDSYYAMPICPHASEGAFCPKSLSYIKNSDLFFVIAILGKKFEKASVREPMENLRC